MTLRTTAHLASAFDDWYAEVEKAHGAQKVRLLHETISASIDRIEEVQRSEQIDCDFARVDGYWFLAPGCPESRLDEEHETCSRLGIPVGDCRDPTPLQGITNGALAGMLVRDLITTGSSPWADLYSPSREISKSLGEYVKENLTPLENFAEYLSASGISAAEALGPGEGRVFRTGLQQVAACRDKDGRLHVRSASCTHLGCIVHWNSTEQCWDCPCHGSQFAPDGTALNGPAVSGLAAVE
jgi:Rieske Fe-S protein